MNTESGRVVLEKGEQSRLINGIIKAKVVKYIDLAVILKVSPRTLSNWRQERYLVPKRAYDVLCGLANYEPEIQEVRKEYWSTSKAGRAYIMKHGRPKCDENYRKEMWRRWLKKKGFSLRNRRNKVSIKKSMGLAELIGIILGDGSVSKYQVTITLNKNDDKEYLNEVEKLIINNLGVRPKRYKREKYNTENIVISNKNFIEYLEDIGIRQGSKKRNNIHIPDWIKHENKYLKHCMRGIFDTDGCIYQEVHKIKSNKYKYLRFAITSYIPNLRIDIYDCLRDLGFKSKIRSRRNIALESLKDIVKYFNLIGSSNPKHIRRFNKFMEGSDNGYSTGLENRVL